MKKSEFREIKRNVMLQARVPRSERRVVDWKMKQERDEWLKEKARRIRLQVIEQCCLELNKCPVCLKRKWKSRSWVLVPYKELVTSVFGYQMLKEWAKKRGLKEVAICKSCLMGRMEFKSIWGLKLKSAHLRVGGRGQNVIKKCEEKNIGEKFV